MWILMSYLRMIFLKGNMFMEYQNLKKKNLQKGR